MRTFKYRNYTIKYSRKGFMWRNVEGETVPWALMYDNGIEVYFETREEAKKAVDVYLGDK